MSRRITKPEDIRNPEHYFNKFMADEVKREQEENKNFQNKYSSLDEILDSGAGIVCKQKLLSITISTDTHLLRSRGYASVGEWLDDIEDVNLYKALIRLEFHQLQILLYRNEYELSQKEIAEKMGITQQAVSKAEKKAKKIIKKYLSSGCEKT
jgi:RNA polymerase sigma factor (sigma-70 family)